MNKNEKATISVKDCGSNNYLTEKLTMRNSNTDQNIFQFNSTPERKTFVLPELPFIKMNAFVCDECAMPLSLYGENFVETYTDYGVNPLRCLCDLHAAEFEEAK